ncbi:UNVERIFIED_ORG: uncharacterized protein (TIGR02594 family) [Rahnella aquatilis]
MKTDDIQKRLSDIGFDPGPVDGFYGIKTIDAIKKFQSKNGLMVDGIPGPQTIAKLFHSDQIHDFEGVSRIDLVWLNEAIRLFGVTEKPGPGSNVEILDWANDLSLPYHDDDIPWCGLFVAHCINATLPNESLPSNPLKARNWLRFGIKTAPTLGAVMVFWRGDIEGEKGHIGFYTGENDNSYRIIGGNQNDKVCFSYISKSRLLGSYWPSIIMLPEINKVKLANDQKLSWDEL